MKLKVALIRSGSCTEEGDHGSYIGTDDIPLSECGRTAIEKYREEGIYPEVSMVYASNMQRSVETAKILYPKIPLIVSRELQPFCYGIFTEKKYHESVSDKKFTDSFCFDVRNTVPQGGNPYEFRARTVNIFKKITGEMASKGIDTAAVITHAAVIKTILQRIYAPRPYYGDWSMECGKGYLVEYDSFQNISKVLQTL